MKAQVDLEVLVNCNNNFVVAKFLNVFVAAKSLNLEEHNGNVTLLQEEIH